MPLNRLSVEAACEMAYHHVIRKRELFDVIETTGPDGVFISRSRPMSPVAAKAILRADRVFVALLALGFDSDQARAAAKLTERDPRSNWRTIVADVVARRIVP